MSRAYGPPGRGASNKRRQQDDWGDRRRPDRDMEDEPDDDSANVYARRERAPPESERRTGPPAWSPPDSRIPRRSHLTPPPTSKGEDRRTGKGKGKGKGERLGYSSTSSQSTRDETLAITELLTTNTKLLLSVARTQRSQLQLVQYVVLIHEEGQDLKEALLQGRQEYNDKRPQERGPHPLGSIHHHLFQVFAEYSASTRQILNTATDRTCLDLLHDMGKTDSDSGSPIHIFSPKGRVRGDPPPTWVFLLQLNSSTTTGLHLQTRLSDAVDKRSLDSSIYTVRHDNAKAGGLELELSERLSDMQL